MISAVQVTTSPTELIPANVRRLGFVIQNISDSDIFLKMDGSTTALTAANGLKLGPNEYLSMTTSENQIFDAVSGIHSGIGDKEVRIQEFTKVY